MARQESAYWERGGVPPALTPNDVNALLVAEAVRRREWVKELGAEASEAGYLEMLRKAPVGSTGYLHSHLTKTGRIYLPGGRGGGGSYQFEAGVRGGSSLHPIYVHEGTAQLKLSPDAREGLGPNLSASLGTGYIYPRRDRGAASVFAPGERGHMRRRGHVDPVKGAGRKPMLRFEVGGRVIYAPRVRGQKPNPYVYYGYQAAKVYMVGRIQSLPSIFNSKFS